MHIIKKQTFKFIISKKNYNLQFNLIFWERSDQALRIKTRKYKLIIHLFATTVDNSSMWIHSFMSKLHKLIIRNCIVDVWEKSNNVLFWLNRHLLNNTKKRHKFFLKSFSELFFVNELYFAGDLKHNSSGNMKISHYHI